MKEIRVLHIAKYDENRSNGIKSVLEELIPIQKKKIDVDLINLKKKSINNIRLIDYNLVVFHGIYMLEYLLVSKNLKKLRIPYLIVPHCSLTRESLKQSKLKKAIFLKIGRKFLENADKIVFLNEEEKNNSIGVEKWTILPNGVNLNTVLEKKDKDVLRLIYLSRIDINHKGIDLLINSFGKIKKYLKLKNIEINIYGDGKEEDIEKFKKLVEENEIRDILQYHGRVVGEEKKKAFEKSHIFILTSRFEGFPMAVLEAMSYGIPCILTEGTNMRSMIDKFNSGWICKNEIDDISEKIIYALEDYRSNSEKYIKNALNNAENYSWEKVCDKHISEYCSLIKE